MLAEVYHFLLRFIKELFSLPFEFNAFIKQCYEIGVRSLMLISVTGLVIGIVFANQSRPPLMEFGATSWLPSLISIAIVRALAPLVTALISAGRVGSNIGAEIGSMKVSEQIDAMEVSGTNPFKYLVVTRVLATTFMIPILSYYTGFVALLGGFINIHQNELTSLSSYIYDVFEKIQLRDIYAMTIRSLIFGFTIGIVGCYQGYNAQKGTEGVGRAANRSVVIAMFLIFIEELLILQLLQRFKI